ncbi:DUF5004 domain-containing protein [Ferruginibacter yonginensis]|uniref:DUF5004 domain-containing protein n=1 Tax=Ferruginibacter yonginensis TaxID=1310416 RepID=A0ABV8QRR4_9BACT
MKSLSIIFLFPLLNLFYTNKKENKESKIIGEDIFVEYRYISPSNDGVISLILKKDRTYTYLLSNHLQRFSSGGKWEIKKDTLTLNSFIQKNSLPVKVKADSIKTSSEYLRIDWVKNTAGDIVKDAEILINGDTSKSCMPTFDSDCKIKVGELMQLKVRLSNNVTSKWQNIKSSRINHIEITLDVPFALDSYIFYDKEKFILVGNKLYGTEQLKNKTRLLTRNTKYFLTKVR